MIPLLLLLSCTTTYRGEFQGATLGLSLPTGAVLDPKFSGDPSLDLRLDVGDLPDDDACVASLSLSHPSGQERTLVASSPVTAGQALEAPWDGRDDGGSSFDPGPVRALAGVVCDSGAQTWEGADLYVVRLSFSSLDFQSASDGGNVALAYHRLDLLEPGITVLDMPEVQARPDGEDGAALEPPPPWEDPDSPPWGSGEPASLLYNLPVAYVVGSGIRVVATAGDTAVSQHSHATVPAFGSGQAPTVTAVLEGFSSAPFVPGQALTLDGALAPSSLGRSDLVLTWRFETPEGPIPGTFTTRHRLYTLAGPPALRDGTDIGAAPAVPWIGALEDTREVVAGLPPDAAPVLDAIRDWIHLSPYLEYNPGDSAYSGYEGSYIYWDYIWSDLTGWLARDDGIDLYCHSVSCLLSVLAGHWGIAAPQQVLGVGFQTNLLRAAGTSTWGTWYFNSHSVVSPDDGATIWDASVTMDGDDDPSSEPTTDLAPKGLPQAEYVYRLTEDPIDIVNSGLCYVY